MLVICTLTDLVQKEIRTKSKLRLGCQINWKKKSGLSIRSIVRFNCVVRLLVWPLGCMMEEDRYNINEVYMSFFFYTIFSIWQHRPNTL